MNDQGFANQECIGPGAQKRIDLGRVANAAFHNEKTVLWNQPGQAVRRLDVHFKRPQIPIVDADDLGSCIQCLAEFGLVVDLHERIEAHHLCKRYIEYRSSSGSSIATIN